jgi:hypothetical protein
MGDVEVQARVVIRGAKLWFAHRCLRSWSIDEKLESKAVATTEESYNYIYAMSPVNAQKSSVGGALSSEALQNLRMRWHRRNVQKVDRWPQRLTEFWKKR